MENASKALLIAGGVLIAMLIASLGVYFARSYSEETARIYQQMENHKIAEFNQQFLKFEGVDLNVQDVVSIINLAKDSNQRNQITEAPDNYLNTTSLYVRVNFNPSSVFDVSGDILIDNSKTYEIEYAEQFTDNILTKILNREIIKNIPYSCEITTNENTGYINYIEIN